MTWVRRALWLAVLGLYGWWLAQPINLTTADLGRHLTNGEWLWRDRGVLTTNFYSYTDPTHPFVNHHWGSGVLFFFLWKLCGFTGLHLCSIALNLLALAIMFRCAEERSGVGVAALLSILIIPLLASRAEVRPEVLSYLLAALFFRRLTQFRDQGLSLRHLWWLPIVEAVWVNLHSYFLLGIGLMAAFLLESALNPQRRVQTRRLAVIFGATVAATLLNPFGLHGALVPLTIFKEYGYRVLENQSVLFLLVRFAMPHLWLFIGMFAGLVASYLVTWRFAGRTLRLSELLIAVGISVMAWKAYRNLTLFGLLAVPLIATGVGALFTRRRLRGERMAAGVAVLTLGLVVFGPSSLWSPPPAAGRGLGLEPGDSAAADFMKQEQIQGPIFNNYDIGSYLIFHLFPEHRVFVDNRPEAYRAAFFKEVYLPMQEDETIWRRADAQYGFNAIVFHRHDLTPWGQSFLIRRIDDPLWVPVFVDHDTLILLERNERNRLAIERFEIPHSAFQVSNTHP